MQLDRSRIELIIIGVILALLISGVALSLRPGDLFKETRNAVRKNHMEAFMVAVYSYTIESGGFFPDCIPEPGLPAVDIKECYDELNVHVTGLFPSDPDPEHSYMIEYVAGIEKKVRIFSTAPEAEKVEVVQ